MTNKLILLVIYIAPTLCKLYVNAYKTADTFRKRVFRNRQFSKRVIRNRQLSKRVIRNRQLSKRVIRNRQFSKRLNLCKRKYNVNVS